MAQLVNGGILRHPPDRISSTENKLWLKLAKCWLLLNAHFGREKKALFLGDALPTSFRLFIVFNTWLDIFHSNHSIRCCSLMATYLSLSHCTLFMAEYMQWKCHFLSLCTKIDIQVDFPFEFVYTFGMKCRTLRCNLCCLNWWICFFNLENRKSSQLFCFFSYVGRK